tara:strand:+ start:361 stop:849 length:489 start_codon:yes stop_codon:yes gene_type:complete
MKKISDFTEEKFLLLSDEGIKEIIDYEINNYSAEESDKSYFIKYVIFPRFNQGFYEGKKGKLYKDLLLKDFTEELRILSQRKVNKKNENPKKRNLVFGYLFSFWCINTILANILLNGSVLTGQKICWNVPILSQLTPVIIFLDEILIGSFDFRLETQDELCN